MEKLQPEKVSEMLKKKGVEVSVEQAALVLDFMRKLANIEVAQYLDSKKTGMKCSSEQTNRNGNRDPDNNWEEDESEMEIKWILN